MSNLSTRPNFFRRLLAVTTLATLTLGSGAAIATETVSTVRPIEGPYFYGQVAETGQLGATYVVMERHEGQWLGAIYQPNAEFDCFVGQLKSNHLAMEIPDTFTNETFAHHMPVEPETLVASAEGVVAPAPQLVGFETINTLTDNEHRLLNVCQQRLNPVQADVTAL